VFLRVWISWCVMSLIHEGVHELKDHMMGSTIHLDLHIEVLSVSHNLDIV
jgi:divalent metal cation (Fe/Co/Zn/Cd) transporter